jgi:glycosyltransferase involved in cell wall biosynthesis
MKVLLNATTIIAGGAIQVAVSHIRQSLASDSEIEWSYAISAPIDAELRALDLQLPRVQVFDASPARSRRAGAQLRDLARQTSPSLVFTVFGPAYVDFEAPHLLGVADGWVTHSTALAFRSLSIKNRILFSLKNIHKGLWYRRADAWVVEAPYAKSGLVKRCRVPAAQVTVIPNTCGDTFRAAGVKPAPYPGRREGIRLLYLSAYYAHKNLEIIPHVAAELARREPDRHFEFVLSLPEEPASKIHSSAKDLGVEKCIVNAGHVLVSDALALYQTCHICFMPSLLETFSANYPEAMATGRPLVATDLDFARAICGDAAVFFEPRSAEAAADAILDLLGNEALWYEKIENGRRVLADLPTPADRFAMCVQTIRKMVG